jgi:hypothetical protein
MTIERSKGRARPTLPRSSDLAVPEAGEKRAGGRDENGRFAAKNPWGAGARWRHLIADGLGRELPGEAGELGREAHRLYRALLDDLPVDCPSVRSLVAQRARAATLASRYARLGAERGLDTAEGAEALDRAQKWDMRAERLAVTSLDVASKLAAVARERKPIDAHGEVVAAFGGDR